MINVDREKSFRHWFASADDRGRHAEDAPFSPWALLGIVAEMAEMAECILSSEKHSSPLSSSV